MRSTAVRGWLVCVSFALGCHVAVAQAQAYPEGGDVELNARTELRASTEWGSSSSTSASGSGTSSSPPPTPPRAGFRGGAGRSDLRLALQVRFDALNTLGFVQGGLGFDALGNATMTPLVTGGLRLLEERLFAGLALGFGAFSTEDDGEEGNSRSAFGIMPMATYDLLVGANSALYAGALFNLALLGETDTPAGNDDDDAVGVGLTLLAGLRAKPMAELAIGVEAGWGFLDVSPDNGTSVFRHGLMGMLVVETSMEL